MATKIVTKNSSTSGSAPLASDLVQGELAVNVTDKRLYTENASGVIVEVGTNPSTIDINSGTIDGTTIGASSASTGAFTTLTASGEITANGGIALGDNDKATFGAGDDLEIFHDGSNSIIKDSGAGNIQLQTSGQIFIGDNAAAETFALFNNDGAVNLYHNNLEKLATTATGIDVTGTATMDGLVVDGASDLNGTITVGTTYTTDITGNDVSFFRDNGTSYIRQRGGQALALTTNDGSDRQRINIDANGDISFYEDTGTTPKFQWDSSEETLILKGSDAGTAGLFVESSTAGVGARLDTVDATLSNTAVLTNSLLLDSDNHAVIRTDSNGNGSGDFYITVGSSDTARMRVANNGDVSLFEDTGTTAKFFWDASAESLGIGTSSPVTTLTASNTTQNDALGIAQVVNTTADDVSSSTMTVKNHSGTGQFMQWRTFGMRIGSRIITNNGVGDVAFTVGNDSEAMRLTSTGLGIGTSSPVTLKSATTLQVSGNAKLGDDNGRGLLSLGDIASTGANVGIWRGAAGAYAGTGNYLNLGGYDGITFTTGAADISAQTERMRIDSSGRVGIGCVPQGNLDIDVAVDTSLGLRSQTGVIVCQYTGAPAVGNRAQIGLGYGNTYTNVSIGAVRTSATAYGTDDFIIATKSGTADTAPTERMRIDSSGNLLVGTTVAAGTVTINSPSNDGLNVSTGADRLVMISKRGNDGDHIRFQNSAGTTAGNINVTGTTTTYTSVSDQRLKENIADADDAGSKIDAIQVRKYDWKADGSHQDYGMIAQELVEIAPEAVSVPEDAEEMMGVDYSKLVPMLIKEIQSLRNRVAQLEE